MIDVFASAPWYVDHLLPIWLALPPEHRGRFFLGPRARERAIPGVAYSRPGGNPLPILTASFGDYRAAKMAGRNRIALGQHGAGQSYSTDNQAYPGGKAQQSASLFLCPNEHSATRTQLAYPRARVELIGCPKVDTLPRKERDGEPVIALSFHWDGPGIAPELHSAFEHYQPALVKLAKRYRILGHAHPRAVAYLRPFYARAGIEVVASFDEILRRADVYACDNSSSLFEFAATGRPVVVLNAPHFRRDVEHGLRFWAASGVGVNASGPKDIATAIARAIADPPEVREARERALDIVYQPRTGGAALAAAALVEWSIAEPTMSSLRNDTYATRLVLRQQRHASRAMRVYDRTRVRTLALDDRK